MRGCALCEWRGYCGRKLRWRCVPIGRDDIVRVRLRWPRLRKRPVLGSELLRPPSTNLRGRDHAAHVPDNWDLLEREWLGRLQLCSRQHRVRDR